MSIVVILLMISFAVNLGLLTYIEYLVTLKNLYKDSLDMAVNAKNHYVDYEEIMKKVNKDKSKDEWVMK